MATKVLKKDDEAKGVGNSYTTFYRQLDPRVGRWFSIDPKMSAWESPYVSMGNCPISRNDIFGDSIKDKTSGIENKALIEFSKTKDGIRELQKFAAKGDVIGNHTFTEDGIYSKKGIDLIFTDKKDANNQGLTEHEIINKRLKITINISSDMTIHPTSLELDKSNKNNGNVNNPEKHKQIWNKAVAQKSFVITHELFVHAYILTVEALDGKMEYNVAGKTGAYHHNYFGCAVEQNMSLIGGKVQVSIINHKHIANLFIEVGWRVVKAINDNLDTRNSEEDLFKDFCH